MNEDVMPQIPKMTVCNEGVVLATGRLGVLRAATVDSSQTHGTFLGVNHRIMNYEVIRSKLLGSGP